MNPQNDTVCLSAVLCQKSYSSRNKAANVYCYVSALVWILVVYIKTKRLWKWSVTSSAVLQSSLQPGWLWHQLGQKNLPIDNEYVSSKTVWNDSVSHSISKNKFPGDFLIQYQNIEKCHSQSWGMNGSTVNKSLFIEHLEWYINSSSDGFFDSSTV